MTTIPKIAVMGKGGVGKTWLASGLSVALARGGRRVLHVANDPKDDTGMLLLEEETEAPPVIEAMLGRGDPPTSWKELVVRGTDGVVFCDAGGGTVGAGCPGNGVVRSLELLEELDLFDEQHWDAVVFDTTADMVCAGFAGPLRAGFANLAVVVTDETPKSLLAANSLSRLVVDHRDAGLRLAGLVLNLRNTQSETTEVEIFARLIGTRVIAAFGYDAQVHHAERLGQTVLHYAPDSDTSRELQRLSADLMDMVDACDDAVLPMDRGELLRFIGPRSQEGV